MQHAQLCFYYVFIIGGDQPYQDYGKQSNALKNESISQLDRRICYNQTIYDDKRLEAVEYIGLSLQIQDLVEIGGPTTVTTRMGVEHTVIKIIDNDGNLIVAHRARSLCSNAFFSYHYGRMLILCIMQHVKFQPQTNCSNVL